MPNQTHNSNQSRLTDMPNQAQDYAKSGKKISHIRLTCRKKMPNRATKYTKSGDHYETHWNENPVILSTPVSDKGIGHTYNEEKQTRS